MKRAVILFAILVAQHGADGQRAETAVVKVYCTSAPVTTYQPWIPDQPIEQTGTGFVITGRRILTNAHVVDFATFIQVKRAGQARRYTASIAYITHDADIAVLTVEDTSFFDGVTPLELGGLPNVEDKVTVIGYPAGGDEISRSTGIVSRIEVRSYAHSCKKFLTIQVDAAINPGNSGGPALMDGKVVGMAMQGIAFMQGMNYLIPVDVILHFLTDVEDGCVDGFPALPVFYQGMENPMLREYFGLDRGGDNGVLVIAVNYEERARTLLKEDDVILEIDGHRVLSNGKYELAPAMLVDIGHIMSAHQVGDTVTYTVLRRGQIQRFKETAIPRTELIPRTNHSTNPPFYIVCGFVFIEHNRSYYEVFGRDCVPPWIQVHDFEPRRENLRGVVYLHTVLTHEENAGYFTDALVRSVNDTRVKSFEDFIRLVETSPRWVRIRFEDNSLIVIDKDRAAAVDEAVLETYRIPSARFLP